MIRHEISYLIFFRKLGKNLQNLSSAAVVIGALMVNMLPLLIHDYSRFLGTWDGSYHY